MFAPPFIWSYLLLNWSLSTFKFCLDSIHSPHRVDCIKRRLRQLEDSFQYFLIRCLPFTEVLISSEIAVTTPPRDAFRYVVWGGLGTCNQFLLCERRIVNNYKAWHLPYLLMVPPKSLEVRIVAPANLEIYAFPLVHVAEEFFGLCNTRYSGRNNQ